MTASRRIARTWYGPEELKAMGQAFDEAWEQIAGNFGSDGPTVENARLKLAEAMLLVASGDRRSVEQLKNAALEVMALNYRTGNARIARANGTAQRDGDSSMKKPAARHFGELRTETRDRRQSIEGRYKQRGAHRRTLPFGSRA